MPASNQERYSTKMEDVIKPKMGRKIKRVDMKRVRRMLEEDKTLEEISKRLGVSRNTLRARMKEHNNHVAKYSS